MNLDPLISKLEGLRDRVSALGDLDAQEKQLRLTVNATNAECATALKNLQKQQSELRANADKANRDLNNDLAARQQRLNDLLRQTEAAQQELVRLQNECAAKRAALDKVGMALKKANAA
jgi:chromosome segregation ATPase